ncbi:unnamed protein product [Acidocella sp. C78]|nr:unnamed protein product [Acidocella sp. C78]
MRRGSRDPGGKRLRCRRASFRMACAALRGVACRIPAKVFERS